MKCLSYLVALIAVRKFWMPCACRARLSMSASNRYRNSLFLSFSPSSLPCLQLRRLFQQYLGGSSLTGAPMVDRFVVPPTASSRIVDYVVVMTVKLAPQLEVDSDKLSDVRQVRDVSPCPCVGGASADLMRLRSEGSFGCANSIGSVTR